MQQEEIDETISLLQKLIQNSCVNPPGNEIKSIETIQDFFENKGITCKIFKSKENKANLIARIKGTENGPSLMFGPSHVDVVPVDNVDDWTIPPFSGEIRNGFIWGRGSFDMLFIVAAQCQAFAKLVSEGFKPKGDLILAIVSDEEIGADYGTAWMVKNHPQEMKADYAISEFGGVQLSPGNFVLSVGEKGAAWIRISFKGTSGAASMPFKTNNPVIKAAEAAQRIENYKTPVNTKYLRFLAKGFGAGMFQRILLSSKILLPLALNQLFKTNPPLARGLHSLSCMTIAPTRIVSGIKTNLIPSNSYIDVDVRMLPGQKYDYIITHLKKALGKKLAKEAEFSQITDEEGMISFGNESATNNEFVVAMTEAVNGIFPNSSFVPTIAYGATDLRFIRELGGKGYGFSLIDPDLTLDDLLKLPHGTDEKVSLKTIELTLDVYYKLAKLFLG